MNDIIKRIGLCGILPVVSLNNSEDALGLAKALSEGGIPVIEVTFRTEAAAEAIKSIHMTYPDMVVGAGTVLTTQQVDIARNMGAMFFVSPGYDEEIVEYCQKIGMPIIPGITNSSDIQKGIKAGLSVFKFFPSEPMGGLRTINFLSAPFRQIKFIPAGGIGFENLRSYLSNEHVLACAGGFVAREPQINNKEWDVIAELSKKAIKIALDFKLHHVGINFSCSMDAQQATKWFENIFDFFSIESDNSFFSGNSVELMKKPYYGENGHIAFSTLSVERAIAWLERKGQRVVEETIRYDAKGRMDSVYLEGDIGGFAIHIVRDKN